MIITVKYDTLTWQERKEVREQYIDIQKGMCIYCGNPLELSPTEKVLNKKINWSRFPKNFLKYPVHLHHNHKTGLTIGVVHALCNAVLFEYEGE